MTQQEKVCVIIAAKNAQETIGRAVRSALAEPEVAEVVVVDDGSNDRTMAAAAEADDGSKRLDIIRFRVNRGPSAARNHAIAISRAPLISILDADDFFFCHGVVLSGLDFHDPWPLVGLTLLDSAREVDSCENFYEEK